MSEWTPKTFACIFKPLPPSSTPNARCARNAKKPDRNGCTYAPVRSAGPRFAATTRRIGTRGNTPGKPIIRWLPRRNPENAGCTAFPMTRLSSTRSPVSATNRADLLERYRRNRARSRQLFALLSDAAYYSRPIALRHPIVFYEGHLPGFSFNTLVKKALGRPSVDADLEQLFARRIDPHESATGGSADQRPS